MDKEFIKSIDYLKNYGIHIKPSSLPFYYKRVSFYPEGLSSKELHIRELGGQIYKWERPELDPEPFCPFISTTVYEDFFLEGDKITNVIDEIMRITNNAYSIKVLSETEYNQELNSTVKIDLEYCGQIIHLEHEDIMNAGFLDEGFLTKQFFPSLNRIKPLNLLYYSGGSLTLIYFHDATLLNRFKDDFPQYKSVTELK